MRRSIATALAIAAAVLALPSGHAAGEPARVGIHDCDWTEFTRLPGFSTFPDTNTLVYQSVYSAGPAHDTVIRGRAPSARFWSFAVLDQARREVANLSDEQIELQQDGSYTVRVSMRCDGAPNCLSLGTAPVPAAPERVFYRVYVPDIDDTGGVGLPEVSYESDAADGVASLELADGMCAQLLDDTTTHLRPGGDLHEALAQPSGLEPAVAAGATGADPSPNRAEGTGSGQIRRAEEAGVPSEVTGLVKDAAGQGGFGATQDNAYVSFGYNIRQGDVVMRAKAPIYRRQHQVAANDLGVASGEQVRYWSLCTTQESRPIDCLRDENVVLDQDGFFEITIAPDCAGVANCLRAGVLGAAGGAQVGLLLYRNLLGADGFFTPSGPHECPVAQAMFCGEYTLQARYVPRP